MNRIFKRLRVRYNQIFHRQKMESHLRELHIKPGEMDMTFKFPEIAYLASEIGRLFIQESGINYVEFSVYDPVQMQGYTVTIHKTGGRTPHSIAKQMRTALEQIETYPEDAQAIATALLTELGYKNIQEQPSND